MLYRKIQPYIESYLKSDSNKVLIIDGARQIGKTFIIRHVGQQLFENAPHGQPRNVGVLQGAHNSGFILTLRYQTLQYEKNNLDRCGRNAGYVMR